MPPALEKAKADALMRRYIEEEYATAFDGLRKMARAAVSPRKGLMMNARDVVNLLTVKQANEANWFQKIMNTAGGSAQAFAGAPEAYVMRGANAQFRALGGPGAQLLGAGIGGLAGAGIGGLAGYLLGDERTKARNMILGALGGTAYGAPVGSYISDRTFNNLANVVDASTYNHLGPLLSADRARPSSTMIGAMLRNRSRNIEQTRP
jgi:hypothetical protein